MKKYIAIVVLLAGHMLLLGNFAKGQALDSAEYFYDVDPGIGNGTAISLVPADTTLDSAYFSTAGLGAGFHFLFVRVKDTNNIWSLYEGQRFYIADTLVSLASASSAPISYGEYYYDSDPGIGNGIPISAFATADSITHTDTLSTAILSAGDHRIYVRVKDTLNIWSHYEGQKFTICNFIPKPDFGADTVCVLTPTTFTDLSTNIDTNFAYTYAWYFNNDLIVDDTTKGNTSCTYNTPGTHTVSLIVNNTNGCVDTIQKLVYVDSLPTVTFTLITDTICKDDTVTLAGGSPVGGVYGGPGVYGGALYGDSVVSGFHNLSYTYYTSDSCSATAYSKIFVSSCTGINETLLAALKITIIPNPFQTQASITINNYDLNSKKLTLSVIDVFGKEILVKAFESNSLELKRGNLAAGVYFYRIKDGRNAYAAGKLVVVN